MTVKLHRPLTRLTARALACAIALSFASDTLIAAEDNALAIA